MPYSKANLSGFIVGVASCESPLQSSPPLRACSSTPSVTPMAESDQHQHAAAAEQAAAAIDTDVLPAGTTAPPKKERTEEQRAQRQALRAAKLARKQQAAAARRQQKAAQAKANPTPEERKEHQPEADEADEDSEQQLEGSGSAVYGNFHNYYAFNAVSERLQFLTAHFIHHVLHRTSPLSPSPAPQLALTDDSLPSHSLLPPCTCPSSDWSLPAAFPPPERPDSAATAVCICDLGCNEGDLTVELVSRLNGAVVDGRPVVAVGVDIDGELIRRASQKSEHPRVEQFLHSMAQPANDQPAAASYLSFYQANLICSATFASLHSLHLQPTQPASNQPPFHLITCFSLLMWLHLCYGSTQLCNFLSTLAPLTSHLVIELQGWRHYRSAIERRRRHGLDEQGVWRWSEIEADWRGRGGEGVRERVVGVLLAGGMREVGVLGKTKWGREVIWFSRVQSGG